MKTYRIERRYYNREVEALELRRYGKVIDSVEFGLSMPDAKGASAAQIVIAHWELRSRAEKLGATHVIVDGTKQRV